MIHFRESCSKKLKHHALGFTHNASHRALLLGEGTIWKE